MKIKYILPEILNLSRNKIIVNVCKNYHNLLNDNIMIYSFFGCFPSAIWNGGSIVFGKKFSVHKIKKIKRFHNQNKIKITLTFTNPLIKEEHLKDKYCNKILKVFHDGYNEVLVSSPVLEIYIRKNYPKYKINRSIIASEKIPYETMNYNLTVINKKYNNNMKYLQNITKKEKIEILCDEICVNDCPYQFSHYKEFANIQLGNGELEKNNGMCRFIDTYNKKIFLRNTKSKYYISYDDIRKIYIPMGFKYFKLSGRGKNNQYGLQNIVDYCIKKEYQYDILTYILENSFFEYYEEYKKYKRKNIDPSKLDL